MAKKVEMQYRFYIQSGRESGTYKTIARAAMEKARTFFSDEEQAIEVECYVQGKPDNWTVECSARATVEVLDGR